MKYGLDFCLVDSLSSGWGIQFDLGMSPSVEWLDWIYGTFYVVAILMLCCLENEPSMSVNKIRLGCRTSDPSVSWPKGLASQPQHMHPPPFISFHFFFPFVSFSLSRLTQLLCGITTAKAIKPSLCLHRDLYCSRWST